MTLYPSLYQAALHDDQPITIYCPTAISIIRQYFCIPYWLCHFHIRCGQIRMVGSTVIGNGGGKITLQVSHYDR